MIALYIPEVIMPKKGWKNQADQEHESTPRWKQLKHRHSAVESNINNLEHHGPNRCPDKGSAGYRRYAGFGILAYNPHKIGAKLPAKQRNERKEPGRPVIQVKTQWSPRTGTAKTPKKENEMPQEIPEN